MAEITTLPASEASSPMPGSAPAPSPTRRRETDHFLIGIVSALALLVLVAVVMVFVLRQPPRVLPANTPGGVVQRYLSAIDKRAYDEAYDYLSGSMKDKPTRAEFVQSQMGSRNTGSTTQVYIGKESVYGDQASVEMTITTYYQSSSPFPGSNEWSYTNTVSMVRENGQWRINTPVSYY